MLMKNIMTFLLFLFLMAVVLVLVYSKYNRLPEDVRQVLNKAGKNPAELETVIAHYKNDALKLKAAYYLISNMDSHYAYDGEVVRNFDPIFDHRLFTQKNIKIPVESPCVKELWKKLIKRNGSPSAYEAEKVADPIAVKATDIIENIDFAYQAWKETKWSKDISFELFCSEPRAPFILVFFQPSKGRPFSFHRYTA